MTASPLSVADRLDLAELPAKFCHFSDYGDFAALADLFTEDVVTELVGIGVYEGIDALVQHARDTAGWSSGHTWHVVANLWIEPTSQGAAVHYYMLGMFNTAAGERAGVAHTSGRFVDHAVRTAAGWRINRRVFRMDAAKTPPDLR
ncbi:nuclear transport factor 2 family protein [Uniformispora flossi]|uniref:nuclear transport factor 2 family protein n=1 Tax=Uniformispora flossi TaxID=3390723 RepID=UPI003C2C3601